MGEGPGAGGALGPSRGLLGRRESSALGPKGDLTAVFSGTRVGDRNGSPGVLVPAPSDSEARGARDGETRAVVGTPEVFCARDWLHGTSRRAWLRGEAKPGSWFGFLSERWWT